MERGPRISVLVTSYNRAATLGAAIESVLASTYGDFELLVVDNCSQDETVAIARGYAARDRRVRVHVNESNLGQFGNRNRAAALARAPFLKYHDSDDVMYPHCLAAMLGPLAAEPRAGFALSGGVAWPGGPCPMLLTPRDCYAREFLGLGLFYCGPAGALFCAEAFRALGGFVDRGAASDFLFWLRACRSTSVLLVPGDLFWYRMHPGQEYASPAALASYARAHGEVWPSLGGADCPLAGAELEQARRNWAWTLFRLTRADLRHGRARNALLRLRHCGLALSDWLRYLRRPRRDRLAGTPLDAAGDFLIPDWSRFELPPGPPAAGAPVPGRER